MKWFPTNDPRKMPKLDFVENVGWYESKKLLLWVANARGDDRIVFGHVLKFKTGVIEWIAHGFSRTGWNISHWTHLPKSPTITNRGKKNEK